MKSHDTENVVADIVAFSVIGIATATQQLVHVAAEGESDDLELIAEESLGLVSVVTARVLSFVLNSNSDLSRVVVPAILEVPLRYYDYILGNQILEKQDRGEEDVNDSIETPYSRLVRKIQFYTAHFPDGIYPGPKLLTEKLGLYVGRISAPGRNEHPEQRVIRLGLTDSLGRHLRLVRGFVTQLLADFEQDPE